LLIYRKSTDLHMTQEWELTVYEITLLTLGVYKLRGKGSSLTAYSKATLYELLFLILLNYKHCNKKHQHVCSSCNVFAEPADILAILTWPFMSHSKILITRSRKRHLQNSTLSSTHKNIQLWTLPCSLSCFPTLKESDLCFQSPLYPCFLNPPWFASLALAR